VRSLFSFFCIFIILNSVSSFNTIWFFFYGMCFVDRYMQWILLWKLLSQQELQTENVDRKLVRLVCYVIQMLPLNPIFFHLRSLVLWFLIFRYTEFGGAVPYRPAEDLAFSVARFIQNRGSYVNYYMVFFAAYLIYSMLLNKCMF
jgi:hypothetical protein